MSSEEDKLDFSDLLNDLIFEYLGDLSIADIVGVLEVHKYSLLKFDGSCDGCDDDEDDAICDECQEKLDVERSDIDNLLNSIEKKEDLKPPQDIQ